MASGGKRQNAGRKKGVSDGTTSKIRLDLIEKLEAQGVDPAESLAWVFTEAKAQYIRKRDEQTNGWGSLGMLDLARHAASDLMDYVYPKRKAVELTGKDGADLGNSFLDLVKLSVEAERNKK